ncbi:MAG: alpha-galactosidase [Propionibacteriaceae bacterium]|jgi:alpha-galactosidase|nr:alpha-galactosidase [Propionibacteriaceae bacterium]MDX6321891.1 alpha-galactosidase [Propionibacteriaceae bacterium]
MTPQPNPTTYPTVPPRGWNSWDCYGTTVTEAEVLANAEYMAAHLLPTGWRYVVVDIQWYEPTARAHGYNDNPPVLLDDHGRQLPAPNRFPSAADGAGFAPLASRVHQLGLLFGLHIMRGIPRRAVEHNLPVLGTEWTAADVADQSSTCSWNPDNFGLNHDHPGAQAYYDSQVAQFAAWGVDFIKIDDMLSPYHDREIAAYAEAIRRSGRDITLSLSPGGRLSIAHLDHLRSNAQMWRVSDDLWDRWSDVYDQFSRMARWAPLQTDGGWADADMLPLGRIGIRAERGDDRRSRLTPDEQRTMMTLWCIARSPLMFGGDLPSNDEATLSLITNADVLAMASGRNGREILREGDLIIWTAESREGDLRYVAVFWTGDEAGDVTVEASSLPAPAGCVARDLWSGESVAVDGPVLSIRVPAHGVRLLQFPA